MNEIKGFFYGFLGVFIFSFTLPATRFAVLELPPLFIALGRASLAGIVSIFILATTKSKLPNKKQFYQLIITALGVVIGFPVFSAWSMQFLPSSHGAIVLGLLPILTVIFSSFFFKVKPSFGFWICAFLGSTIVIGYTFLQGLGKIGWADLALFAGVSTAAIGYAVGSKLSQDLGGWRVICWSLAIMFPFIVIPTFFLFPNNAAEISIQSWSGFLYLSLMSQLIGFVFWYHGLAIGGVFRVSQVQLLQPFMTIIAANLLLAEILDALTIISCILIIVIIAISKRMPIYNNNPL